MLWVAITVALLPVQFTPLAGVVAKAAPTYCSPPTVGDFEIDRLEITQGIQSDLHEVSLIAARSTIVRAQLKIAPPNTTWTWIKAQLTVTAAGLSQVYTKHVRINKLPAGVSIWGSMDCTITFTLTSPLIATPNAKITLELLLNNAASTLLTDKSVTNIDVTAYVTGWSPRILFVPIDYTLDNQPYPLGSAADTFHAQLGAPYGNAFIWGILPVDDHAASYQQLAAPSILPFATNITDSVGATDAEINVYNPAEGCALALQLSQLRNAVVVNNIGPTSQDFIYGWVYGDQVIDDNGYGANYGRVAFGNTEIDRGQRTFAHELLHNFGNNHVNATTTLATPGIGLPGIGWDVGKRLFNSWVGNGVTTTLKAGALNAIMVPGLKTYQAWSTVAEYKRLQKAIVNFPPIPKPGENEERVFQVAVDGCVNGAGDQIVGKVSVVRYPWYSEPTNRYLPDGPFTLTLQFPDCPPVTVKFDGRVGTDPDDRAEVDFYGLLHVVADVPINCTLTQVTIERDGIVLYTSDNVAGAEPPSLDMITPVNGDVLAQETEVAWVVNDNDTAAENLTTNILYSYDDGNSWLPLRVDVSDVRYVENNRVIVPTDRLPRLEQDGTSIIRIVVSDGLHTVYGEATRLTAKDGIIQ